MSVLFVFSVFKKLADVSFCSSFLILTKSVFQIFILLFYWLTFNYSEFWQPGKHKLIKKWLGQDDKYLFHIPIPCSKSFLLAQHYLFQKCFFLFYTRIFFIWKIKLPPPPPPRDLHAQQLQKQLNRSNTISKHLYKCTNNFILSFSYWWNSL